MDPKSDTPPAVQQKNDKTAAVLFIQKHVRGFVVRKQYKDLRTAYAESKEIERSRSNRAARIRAEQLELAVLSSTSDTSSYDRLCKLRRKLAAKKIQRKWRWRRRYQSIPAAIEPQESTSTTTTTHSISEQVCYDTDDFSECEAEDSIEINPTVKGAKMALLRQRISNKSLPFIEAWEKENKTSSSTTSNILMQRYKSFMKVKYEIQDQYEDYQKTRQQKHSDKVSQYVARCDSFINALQSPPALGTNNVKVTSNTRRLEVATACHQQKLSILRGENRTTWSAYLNGEVRDVRKLSDESSDWWKSYAQTESFASTTTGVLPDAAIRTAVPTLKSLDFYQSQYDASIIKTRRKVDEMTRGVISQIQASERLKQRAEESHTSSEDVAATCIQCIYRGYMGRKEAAVVRADVVVTRSGASIRKGLCQECGESVAVLECTECDSDTATQYCPQCWVHLHSTRRRRNHKAHPIISTTTHS